MLARIAALFRRLDAMRESQLTNEAELQQGDLSMDTLRMVAKWKDQKCRFNRNRVLDGTCFGKICTGHVKNRQQLDAGISNGSRR